MKKYLLLTALTILLLACNQQQRYTQNSPEIDIYKKSMKAYENKNWDEYQSFYADTAKIVNNATIEKAITIDENVEENKKGAEQFDWDITDEEYEMVITDKGETWVNSWAVWKGTLKSTGKTYVIPFHITARFVNNKIVTEFGYWDGSEGVKDSYEQKLKELQNEAPTE